MRLSRDRLHLVVREPASVREDGELVSSWAGVGKKSSQTNR